jgi:hypothetical protein
MELEMALDLYLSTPSTIYQAIFDKPVERVMAESHIKLVIINLVDEEVVKWLQ